MVVFDLIDEYYATPSPPSTPEPRVPSQITIIDTTTAMAELVETLPNLPTSPPSLYVDLEGKDLGRNGTIAIMQLHVLPTNHTYLIDVHTLQDAAFTTPSPSPSGSDATTTASPSPSGSDATTTASPSPSGSDAAAAASPSPSGSDDTTTTTTTTFKSILESPTIPKVFFDVRHDSDALYHLYGINLAGVQDLQLMEHAQSPHKNYVRGLAKCIQYDAGLSRSEVDESQTVKAVGKELWSPELGGSFDVFAERPMRDEIVQYCAQDAWVLPLLYERYEVRIGRMYGVENLRVALAKETEQRVRDSQSEGFASWGREEFTRAPGGIEWESPWRVGQEPAVWRPEEWAGGKAVDAPEPVPEPAPEPAPEPPAPVPARARARAWFLRRGGGLGGLLRRRRRGLRAVLLRLRLWQ